MGVDGAALSSAHVDDAVIIWAHFDDFLKAPRCFQAHILKQESQSKPLALTDIPAEVSLEATWECQNSWKLCRWLDKSYLWYIRYFVIVENARPLGTVTPNRCSVREMRPLEATSPTSAMLFWKGERDKAHTRRKETERITKMGKAAAKKGNFIK